MPKIAYERKSFRAPTLALIQTANSIIAEYTRQGYDLTLRQLYYQLVARDIIENSQRSYKRVGSILNDARMAGLVDWTAIVDRTRNLAGVSHWSTPADIIDSAAASFRIDKWSDQPYRVEVWVEKEALAGVVGRVARRLDVDYMSCRGYMSQSEMWEAGQRLRRRLRSSQNVRILHLGDHDPSGIDMTRDIIDRLSLFTGTSVQVDRLALNYDQIEQYNPPPNFAKESDSRYAEYQELYGDDSWELDALEPSVLAELITEAVKGYRDEDLYARRVAEEEEGRAHLKKTAENWPEIAEFVEDLDTGEASDEFVEEYDEEEYDEEEE